MIEAIATDVSEKLNNYTPSRDFDRFVGMGSQMRKMRPLLQLDSDEVRVIGILGPSGIGKTTIARYIFNRLSPDFHVSVFMDNIKTKYAKPSCSDDYGVKLDLQKQLMSQLTNDVDIINPHLGMLENRLKDEKFFLVLDDVDQSVQLEAMVNETWFGPGSRIIITTQDQNILTVGGVKHIYIMDLPSDDEALQMFCMYAFGQKLPKDGFKKLVSEVTRLVGKLPLGIRIMGSHFKGMCEEEWTKELPSLKTHLDRNGEIMSILKYSYDALCDVDKISFLHIACFFIDEQVDIVEGCLASSFSYVTRGLRVLSEKSLIDVDGGIIKMQELLVQLGRKIMREQSELGNRQYLNDAIDIRDVFNDDKPDSSSVLGIDYLDGNITCPSESVFERLSNLWFKKKEKKERLSNLQFLRIHSDGISPQSLNSISGKLRFLYWPNFPIQCFPSSFNPNFLVKLDMPWSKLKKLWKKTQPLSNLKWMNLRDSERLEELPGLSSATNLYDLNLSGCLSLVKLPSSIGKAINLRKLNLSDCSSLVELPSSIGNAVNLQILDLSDCSSLVELSFSMRNLRRLSKLKLEGCSKLEVLLTNINLESLEELNLCGCSLLKSYPESSTNNQDLKPTGTTVTEAPSSMESLPLLCKSEICEIQELGPWIGRTSCLRKLVLTGMKNLVSLPQLPYSVVELEVSCESLERLDCSFLNPGICLNFQYCFKLNQEARDLIIQMRTNRYAVLPGGEVPRCFTYQNYGGTLTVNLNQKHLGTSTKFKACIICAGKFECRQTYVSCSITSKENNITCYKKIEPFLRGNLYIFEVEAEEVTSTKLVFEFEINHLPFDGELGKTWRIKECGIFQILEVPSC